MMIKVTRYIALGILAIASHTIGAAQPSQSSPSNQSGPASASSEELKTVLARMNEGASNFRSFQADFEWEYYDAMVRETTIQKGKAYFRRKSSANKRDTEALFDINSTKPVENGALVKQVLYKDGKIYMYEKGIDHLTDRAVGKNKSDVDAFMSLGLGGRGDDLAANFKVNWLGWETVDGVKTAKLEVTGKTPSIQKVFSKAILWIDPEKDVALKQQFFMGSQGDYRLTRYSNVKYNGKVSDDDFRLQTTGNTVTVHLQAK